MTLCAPRLGVVKRAMHSHTNMSGMASMKRPINYVFLMVLTAACGSTSATTVVAPPDEVSIQNFAFNPTPRTVAAGTTVTWINHDSAAHTATGGSGPETWNSGSLAENGSFSHTFTSPGTYTYACSFHPGMHGTIIVN